MQNAVDAFVNFVNTGKMGWETFANVAIEQLARIAAQQAVLGLSGIFSEIGSTVVSFFANAKGGVYDSPSLSKYSNQVHSTPKVFAFAKGAGVFGEAGPEAIMPLTRGPDGTLGVRNFKGSNQASGVVINIETNINGTGADQTATQGTDNGNTKQLAEAFNAKIKMTIARETQTNGIIWRLVNGR